MEEHSEDATTTRQRDALFGPASSSSRRPPADSLHSNMQLGGRSGWDMAAASGSATAAGGQQLSWAEVRGKIDVAERQQGLRSAYESVEVGRETLEHLDDQKERLERSEMVLDSTRYAIERSARVLRGMSFWGKIRNAFTDDVQIPQAHQNSRNPAAGSESAGIPHEAPPDDDLPQEGFICPDCRRRFLAADALVTHFGLEHTGAGGGQREGMRFNVDAPGAKTDLRQAAMVGQAGEARISEGGGSQGGNYGEFTDQSGSLRDQLFGSRREAQAVAVEGEGSRNERKGGVIAEQKTFMAEQDAYLDSVGQAVAELGLLGRNIGASLDAQGGTLERVAEKTEEANDRTAFVTRKAARRAQSSRPKKPTFLMSVALQEVSTGLFLTVTGEEVVLQERELRNICRFDAWQRQHGIVGFKSGVTGRWLGQTWLGYLRVSGTSFGKNYEWQADLGRKQTTLVCCSANWGAGGYLSVSPNMSDSISARAEEVSSNAGNDSGNLRVSTNGSYLPPRPPDVVRSRVASTIHQAPSAERAEVTLVDATLANKSRAAVFQVVNCDGYTPQPFVGGKLMQNPTRPDGGQREAHGDGESNDGNGWGAGWATR